MPKRSTKNLEMRVMKGNITINEIADQLGVARNTAHRWFSNKEMDAVQKGRVMKAIEEIKEKGKSHV